MSKNNKESNLFENRKKCINDISNCSFDVPCFIMALQIHNWNIVECYASQPIQPPCSDIESDLNINLKYTGYYFLSKKKEMKKSRKKKKKLHLMDTPLILQCILIISCTLVLNSNFKRKMLGENDEGILKIKMDVLEQEERVLVLSFNALNIFRFCIYINAYLSIYLLILLN